MQDLDVGTPTEIALPPFDWHNEDFSIASNNISEIFVTGGHKGNMKPTNRVLKFDIHAVTYWEMPALIQARYCHASIVYGFYLYAFGGKTSVHGLSR